MHHGTFCLEAFFPGLFKTLFWVRKWKFPEKWNFQVSFDHLQWWYVPGHCAPWDLLVTALYFTTLAQTHVHDVTQTSAATVQHKPAFLQNTTYSSHHLNSLSDNLIPPESNRSFSPSSELNWDYFPSLQWKMHRHSWPWQSVALPSSKESIKYHFETDIFTSGLSFLAFVSRCCREFSNALPNTRTEAFGLGISTGERSHACPMYLQTPSHLGRENTPLERNASPHVSEL